MIMLTIFGKDETKQVINCSNDVMYDKYNNKLSSVAIANKMKDTATDIAKNNYAGHKFRVQH